MTQPDDRPDGNGAPDIRFMIMPTSTVEIVDNWHVYPDSAGTRTNRLPKREIGILLTE